MSATFSTGRLTLRQALTYYATNQAAAARYIQLRLLSRVSANARDDDDALSEDMRSGPPLSPGERAELLSWRTALAEDLQRRLVNDELSAQGFRSGAIDPIAIPADWWRGAVLDLERNAATAHGTTLTGLVVTGGDMTQMATPAEAPQPEKKPLGGRPPHTARKAFSKAMLKRANTPDGLGAKGECTLAMIAWAADEFGDDAPGDTTIREWVREDWPD